MTSHINLNMLRFLRCYYLHFTRCSELLRASLSLGGGWERQVVLGRRRACEPSHTPYSSGASLLNPESSFNHRCAQIAQE